MYDTYLFDLDETLVYTTDAGKEFVVTEALSEFSVEPTFHEILDLWYGRNRDQLIKKAWNLIPEEFWVVYNQKDTVEFRKEYTRPYKDAKIVARIKNAGSDIGVVTASREEIADYGLGLIGRDLFDALVSTHGDPLKKPHRDPVDRCMEILGANRYSTVFVGNSGDDIEAAQNAGIRAILIDRGEYPYKGPVPSEIIENLYQLKDLLAQTPEYLHIP